MDFPAIVLFRRPTRNTNAADVSAIAFRRSHRSEIGQLLEGLSGKKPLLAGAENAFAFERPAHDLSSVCHVAPVFKPWPFSGCPSKNSQIGLRPEDGAAGSVTKDDVIDVRPRRIVIDDLKFARSWASVRFAHDGQSTSISTRLIGIHQSLGPQPSSHRIDRAEKILMGLADLFPAADDIRYEQSACEPHQTFSPRLPTATARSSVE